MGQAFPASTFVGYDIDDAAIARARAEASGAGLANVRFETCDVAQPFAHEEFDGAVVFDAIHDQVDPAGVIGRIHTALVPGGTFLMKEPHAGDDLKDNIGNPMAAALYSMSTLHCMTVSLAHGGAGIGTMFGEGLARRLLTDAGFADIEVHTVPGDPADALYMSRKDN
jgi:SAM-dependent methyltransferase